MVSSEKDILVNILKQLQTYSLLEHNQQKDNECTSSSKTFSSSQQRQLRLGLGNNNNNNSNSNCLPEDVVEWFALTKRNLFGIIHCISYLDLSDKNINEFDVMMIVEAIQHHHEQQSYDDQQQQEQKLNDGTQSTTTTTTTTTISSATTTKIENCCRTIEIDLSDNPNIGNNGAEQFALLLLWQQKQQQQLLKLRQQQYSQHQTLYSTLVQQQPSTGCCCCCCCCCVLVHLILSSTGLGDVGTVAIAQSLRGGGDSSWGGLQELYLEHNQIGDRGAIELAITLKENTTLRDLRLYDNPIGIHGSLAILNAIEYYNDTLQNFDTIEMMDTAHVDYEAIRIVDQQIRKLVDLNRSKQRSAPKKEEYQLLLRVNKIYNFTTRIHNNNTK